MTEKYETQESMTGKYETFALVITWIRIIQFRNNCRNNKTNYKVFEVT